MIPPPRVMEGGARPDLRLLPEQSLTFRKEERKGRTKKFSNSMRTSRHNNPRKGSKHVVAKLIFRSSVREIAPRTRYFG